MATTARLGIDIVGRDRTRGAFSSTQRSLDAINRSVRTIKVGLAGFAGGNILANVIRSFVEINRTSAPVAKAVNEMQRAWQAFALQVGAAGLNEGLINFAKRMGALLISTDGLSQSIGRFLGSGVRIMGQIFEAIGRAIAFAYDNGQIFIRVFAAMAAMNIAIRIVSAARAFILLVSALRAASIASALFHLVSRRALIVWAGAAAIFAQATGTLDDLQQAMGWVWQQAEQLIPTIDGGVAMALKRMGFDVTALTTDLGAFEDQLANLPQLMGDVAGAADKIGKPISILPKQLEQTNQILDATKSSFSAFFQQIAQGTNFVKALQSELLNLSQRLLNMATDKIFDMLINFLMQQGQTAPGGTNFGFGGFYAAGGNLGAGKWGIAGENGPEIVQGPASIVPMGGGGMNVVINNNNGSQVSARETGLGDKRQLEIMIDQRQASNNANPYSNTSRILSARGAAPGRKQR